VLPKSSKFETI
jgi:hypothetical protein